MGNSLEQILRYLLGSLPRVQRDGTRNLGPGQLFSIGIHVDFFLVSQLYYSLSLHRLASLLLCALGPSLCLFSQFQGPW